MARARNIKPAIMDNEDLAELPALTRLLFVYLWMLADREGRVEDRPKRIAAQALPYDRSADVDAMLRELVAGGFIARYVAAGVAIIQIVSFLKHQTPHGTERDSGLPDAEGQITVHARGKNGYATGEFLLVNRGLTVKPPSDNTLNPDSGFTDSLIPDTGIETAPAAPAPAPPPAPTPLPPAMPKPKASAPGPIAKPDDVTEQTWADWLQLRAKKRAPVTATVLGEAIKESAKAGLSLERFLVVWCARGSQGLQAEWLKPEERLHGRGGPAANEAPYRNNNDRRADFLSGLVGNAGGTFDAADDDRTFDVDARTVG